MYELVANELGSSKTTDNKQGSYITRHNGANIVGKCADWEIVFTQPRYVHSLGRDLRKIPT